MSWPLGLGVPLGELFAGVPALSAYFGAAGFVFFSPGLGALVCEPLPALFARLAGGAIGRFVVAGFVAGFAFALALGRARAFFRGRCCGRRRRCRPCPSFDRALFRRRRNDLRPDLPWNPIRADCCRWVSSNRRCSRRTASAVAGRNDPACFRADGFLPACWKCLCRRRCWDRRCRSSLSGRRDRPLGIGPLLAWVCRILRFLVGGLRAGFGLVAFALGVGICIVALGVGFRLWAAAGSLAGLGVLIRRFRAWRLVAGFFTLPCFFRRRRWIFRRAAIDSADSGPDFGLLDFAAGSIAVAVRFVAGLFGDAALESVALLIALLS